MTRVSDRAVKVVTTRDLSRRTREVIKMVTEEGRSVLVKSRNLPVAMLVPIRPGLLLNEAGGKATSQVIQPSSRDLTDLPSTERAVLGEILNGNSVIDRLCSAVGGAPGDVVLALARLEVKGLVRRTFSGYAPGE